MHQKNETFSLSTIPSVLIGHGRVSDTRSAVCDFFTVRKDQSIVRKSQTAE